MEIQTRRHILELWRATVKYSYPDGEWRWGGLAGRNSISDAEQLLTILYPATAIESLKLDRVDETARDVLDYLRPLGDALEIPRVLIRIISDYMRTYLVDGTPDFSGDTYFDVLNVKDNAVPVEPTDNAGPVEPRAEQRKLHVVDSYSMSVTLCLSTLSFLRVYRETERSSRTLGEIRELERLASQRLTAALVGLLRSFTIGTFAPSDPEGEELTAMLNQKGQATDLLVRALLERLAEVRASLSKELTLGLNQVADELDNPGRLFECGWSWGVVDGAPQVPNVGEIGKQPTGVAEARPYLYFTVVALDGIGDLFTERTRILGLLNDEQERLSRALQLRWELTQQFWSTVATFGGGDKWPLEDLPWRTTDGVESDYFSLLLTSIVVEGPGSERIPGTDIARVGNLLGDLAERGRITRRPARNDAAIALHLPGLGVELRGSEKVAEGPTLQWTVASFTSLLLKRLLRVAELLSSSADRIPFLDLADQIWKHVERRRIEAQYGRYLWDQPTQVFTGTSDAPYKAPSWYQTERVMEALVAAANVTLAPSTPPLELTTTATQLLAEAEKQFDRERLDGINDTGEQMRESFQVVGSKLRRARELIRDRPGTAIVHINEVLGILDTIDAARQDTAGLSWR